MQTAEQIYVEVLAPFVDVGICNALDRFKQAMIDDEAIKPAELLLHDLDNLLTKSAVCDFAGDGADLLWVFGAEFLERAFAPRRYNDIVSVTNKVPSYCQSDTLIR